jgi:hypothetical protein
MRALVLLSASFLSLAWVPQAQAKGSSKGGPENARAKAAKIACAAGDFRKGVEILAELYVETNGTTYIYNQARCYEQNHQWVSAIDRFREYLRKSPGLGAEDTAETEKHIADCRALQAEEEKQTAPPPQAAAPLVPSPAQPVPPPLEEAPSPAVAPAVPPPPADGDSALPTVGIVVGSVGLAGIATGVILNVKANQAADSGLESSQKSYQTGALICYGVGGAALVAGIVLYLVGHKSSKRDGGNVALSPIWNHGGGGLALVGEF